MPGFRTFVLGLGLTAGFAMLAVAAGPAFDVKTGLWEITSTGATTGAPPIPDDALARMGPEQRAQVEAAMKSAMGKNNQPRVSKSCITQQQLEKAPTFGERHDESCKQSVVTRTASLVETRLECTGQQKMSGTFRFQALSRDAIRGDVNMVMSNGDKKITSKYTIDGKWLAADCGNVKPPGE